ncbi:cell division ATP-binding protein FtsE [Candidatus Shapirobacteria bacterium CG_4_9_14_0_2_um_filter_39_11]|uniref:Cell division ATP-binding protein FtsE n=1 Tax=Candidatus Shapirobacteria bacterium CG_4_9_14_0_2_um_filter_39_11 TaxID=1974478 RepID=A0A2M8ESX1_9BACT|nr:MAG: cell division ATP-binding protein FtsE [Candidatus Shapirobacteria bacterium CG_4_9_14_0_2_um_filter_39_11]
MIKFENVSKKFGEVATLDKVNFELKPGEFVFIIGPSGAGKTTLVKLILKDYLPTAGTIKIGGINLEEIPKRKISDYRRKIGVVFQDFKLLPDRTALENVALALRIFGEKETEIIPKVMEVLGLVGLGERADFFPAQLSAGELQRTCLARAIIGSPEIVLADEPTGNLDLGTARQIVKLLKKINEMGKTIIMTTHNFEIVNQMKERVIELDKGKLISDQKKGKYHFK